jgi:hypothetical protein
VLLSLLILLLLQLILQLLASLVDWQGQQVCKLLHWVPLLQTPAVQCQQARMHCQQAVMRLHLHPHQFCHQAAAAAAASAGVPRLPQKGPSLQRQGNPHPSVQLLLLRPLLLLPVSAAVRPVA